MIQIAFRLNVNDTVAVGCANVFMAFNILSSSDSYAGFITNYTDQGTFIDFAFSRESTTNTWGGNAIVGGSLSITRRRDGAYTSAILIATDAVYSINGSGHPAAELKFPSGIRLFYDRSNPGRNASGSFYGAVLVGATAGQILSDTDRDSIEYYLSMKTILKPIGEALDPYVLGLLLLGNGINNSQAIADYSTTPKSLTIFGNTKVDTDTAITDMGSIYFDGGDDYFNVTHADSIDLTDGNWTIEFYFRTTHSGSAEVTLLSKNGVCCQYYSSFHFTLRDNNLYFAGSTTGNSFNIGGQDSVGLLGRYATNTWYHVAIVKEDVVYSGYLNGVKTYTQTTINVPYSSTRNLVVGANTDSSNNPTQDFTGWLDCFRICKGRAMYTANFTPPNGFDIYRDNVLFLLAGKTSVGIVDSSANKFVVTLNGDITTDSVQKKFEESSLRFSGVNSTTAVVASNPLLDLTGDFTIELWCRQDAAYLVNYPRIIGRMEAATVNGNWRIMVDNIGKTVTFAFDNPITYATFGTFAYDTWTHLAVTRSGSTLRSFKDGVLITTATYSSPLTSNNALVIGGNYDLGTNFKGNIENIRITKGIARYTSSFTVPARSYPLQ
jgi:hypothetical protein